MEKQASGNAHWLLTGASGVVGLAGNLGLTTHKALYILGFIVLAQLTSGICVAFLEKPDMRVKKIIKLCMNKVMIAFIVAFAYLLNDLLVADLSLFSSLVLWFYVTEETLSFLQNMNKLGVPFPAVVQQFFRKQKEKLQEVPKNSVGDETSPVE